MKQILILLFSLCSLVSQAQFLINPYVFSRENTTADGKQIELILGDSRTLAVGEVVGPTTLAGTTYQFVGGSEVELTTAEVSTAAVGSPWKKYALDRNAVSGKKPVFVCAGSSGATLVDVGSSNNWASTGTLRASAISAVNAALTHYNLLRPYRITIIVGINDIKSGCSGCPTPGTPSNAAIDEALVDFLNWVEGQWPGVVIRIAQIGRYVNSQSDDRTSKFSTALKREAIARANLYIVGNLNNYFQWGLYKTSPGTEPLHLTQAGDNKLGEQLARFEKYFDLGYSKWACTVMAAHYNDKGTTAASAWETVMSHASTGYLTRDKVNLYAVTDREDIFVDFAMVGLSIDNGTVTHTAGVGITTASTGSKYLNDVTNLTFTTNATQNDVCFGVKTGTNSHGTATGYLFGSQDAATIGILLFQASSAVRVAVSSLTATVYSTDTKFADNTWYSGFRSASTGADSQGLRKGGTSVATSNVTSTGLLAVTHFVGGRNNNGAVANIMSIVIQANHIGSNNNFTETQWIADIDALLPTL